MTAIIATDADKAALARANQKLVQARQDRAAQKQNGNTSRSVYDIAARTFRPPTDVDLNNPVYAPAWATAYVVEPNYLAWQSFDANRHPQTKAAQKKLAEWMAYLRDLLPESPNEPPVAGTGSVFILAGGFGSGKSHLAQAVYDIFTFLRCGYLQEIEDVVDQIKANYNNPNEGRSMESIAAQVAYKHILIFDDLGEYGTDNLTWMHNIYRRLLSQRVAQGYHTIITTNSGLSQEEWGGVLQKSEFEQRLGGRTYTRLYGGTQQGRWVAKLWDVPDYRLSAEYAEKQRQLVKASANVSIEPSFTPATPKPKLDWETIIEKSGYAQVEDLLAEQSYRLKLGRARALFGHQNFRKVFESIVIVEPDISPVNLVARIDRERSLESNIPEFARKPGVQA